MGVSRASIGTCSHLGKAHCITVQCSVDLDIVSPPCVGEEGTRVNNL